MKPISLARMGAPMPAPKAAPATAKRRGQPHNNLGSWLHPKKALNRFERKRQKGK